MKTRLAQQEAVCKHISKQQVLLKPAVTLDDGLQATNKTHISSQCPSKPDHNSARASVGIHQPYSRLNVQTLVQHSCLLNPKSIKPFSTKDAPICVCQQAANWQKKNPQTNTAIINLKSPSSNRWEFLQLWELSCFRG